MEWLRKLVLDPRTERVIMAVIILNAIVLGLETSKTMMASYGRVLEILDQVSAEHHATQAEVALAWVSAQPGVTAPIASATSVEQVASLAKGARLTLNSRDLALLEEAGR